MINEIVTQHFSNHDITFLKLSIPQQFRNLRNSFQFTQHIDLYVIGCVTSRYKLPKPAISYFSTLIATLFFVFMLLP